MRGGERMSIFSYIRPQRKMHTLLSWRLLLTTHNTLRNAFLRLLMTRLCLRPPNQL
jgi:hypothetical protein